MKPSLWGWSASLLLAANLAAGLAYADDPVRAAQSFAEARAAYERGDYTTAAVGFEQAAAYKAHPGALLNASAAWEEAGDVARAAAACDRAVELARTNEPIAGQARSCLARLEPRVATLSMTGPPSSRVRVDDLAPLALPMRMRLSPGAHDLVEMDADGAIVTTKHLELSRGQQVALVVETPHPPAPLAKPERQTGGGRRVPLTSVVAWSLGGLSLATAAVLGVRAVQAKDSYDTSPSREAQSDFHTSRDLSNVALGVGVVAVAVGIVLYVASPKRRTPLATGERVTIFDY